MKRTIFWALLLIAAGCSSPKNTRTADPLRVTTIVAAPSAGFGAAVYVGSVEEEASASLSFPVAGTVARTLADEGQRVRKGQLLAELDSTSARQTFDAARASLEQAEDACGRLRQLYEAQSLPEIKWVEAQTRLRQAESLFEIAKKNLSDCALYAPFDGVVGERRASAGETVLPGVIIDGGHNEAGVEEFVKTAKRLEKDFPVTLLFAAVGDKDYRHMIETICRELRLERVIVTEVGGYRSVNVKEPKGLFEKFGQKEIKAIPDVKEAFEEALREKGDGILFCVGSLYLVGSIKKILRDKEDGK